MFTLHHTIASAMRQKWSLYEYIQTLFFLLNKEVSRLISSLTLPCLPLGIEFHQPRMGLRLFWIKSGICWAGKMSIRQSLPRIPERKEDNPTDQVLGIDRRHCTWWTYQIWRGEDVWWNDSSKESDARGKRNPEESRTLEKKRLLFPMFLEVSATVGMGVNTRIHVHRMLVGKGNYYATDLHR